MSVVAGARGNESSLLDGISNVGAKVFQGFETGANLVSKVLSEADGLGYVQELIKAIIAALPDPDEHIGEWSKHKIDVIKNTSKNLSYFSTFLTVMTVVSDIAGWFVPDGKGRYQYERKPQHIFKKFCWNLAHYIDLIMDFKNLGIIKSSDTADKAMRVLGIIGSCARIVANSAEIFISIKAIIRSYHKEHSYDLSKKRWQTFATETRNGNMTPEQWIAFCNAKISGEGDDLAGEKGTKRDDFSHIKGWAVKLREYKATLEAKGYTKEKIEADREYIAISAKVSYWEKTKATITNYTHAVKLAVNNPIEHQNRSNKLKEALRYFAGNERVNRCKKGLKIQTDSRVREWINIILSSTVIVGLVLTISFQIAGKHSFFGATGKAIPKLIIALPVVTCSIDLINYIVCNIYLKKAPMKKAGSVPTLDFPIPSANQIGKAAASA